MLCLYSSRKERGVSFYDVTRESFLSNGRIGRTADVSEINNGNGFCFYDIHGDIDDKRSASSD